MMVESIYKVISKVKYQKKQKYLAALVLMQGVSFPSIPPYFWGGCSDRSQKGLVLKCVATLLFCFSRITLDWLSFS